MPCLFKHPYPKVVALFAQLNERICGAHSLIARGAEVL